MTFGIRNKLLGGFGLVLLIFTLTCIMGLYSLQRDLDSLHKTLAYPMEVNNSASDIEVLILSMQQNMVDISLIHDWKDIEDKTSEIRSKEKQTDQLISVIQELMLGNKGKIITRNTRTDFYQWRPIREKVIEFSQKGKNTEAQLINNIEGNAQVRKLLLKLNMINRYSTERVKQFTEESAMMASRAKIMLTLALIVSIVLSVFISFNLSFSITRRLNLLNIATKKMTRGELKQFVEVKGHDELSQVADNFNVMANELSGMYDNLEQRVQERTRELEQTNEELNLIKSDLERKVIERTKDHEEKIRELNRSQLAMLYMIEDLNLTSRQLKDTQEELIRKERLAILGQFSGNISHELRNPLGVIDSSIYYLQMRLKDRDEKIQQHLERISQGVKTSTSIIENLLNLTRMNKPVLTKYNLATLISECIQSCSIPDLVTVIKDFPEEEILVMAEKEQIQMAVNNLVKNAIGTMNEKGMLTVGIRKTSEQEAEITFLDTGPGIDPEHISKIFQPLFSTRAKGIGLGLSITRMVIENHKGTITVESEPGKGANFIIRIPLFTEEFSTESEHENAA